MGEYQKKRTEGVINRVYKYKLKPNRLHVSLLTETLTTQCYLYNRALERRKNAWEESQQHVSLGDLKKEFITQGRKTNQYLSRCNYGICAQTLTRLDLAYKAFFRRVKKGESGGFPKFQSSRHWNTLQFNNYGNGCKVDGKYIVLQNIGRIKMHFYRPLPEGASLRNMAVTRQADGWFVCLTLEIPFEKPEPRPEPVIGIDMGVRAFVTDSNGKQWKPEKFLVRAQEKLACRQQSVSRKVKGSHRRRKEVRLLAKQHLHVACQRKEWHRQIAKQLCLSAGIIVREELDILPMTARPDPIPDAEGNEGEFLPNGAARKAGLNRAILDAGWRMFFAALDSAAERSNTTIVTRPAAYTSQTCAECSTLADPPINVLATAWFHCKSCGHTQDIDHNAARILHQSYAV